MLLCYLILTMNHISINSKYVGQSLSSLNFSHEQQSLSLTVLWFSPGVWWRVRARAGAGGPLFLVLSFSFCCRSVSLVPLRYAQSSGLGFGLGGRSAAEEMQLRRLICFLWILGEEAERWLVVAVGSWVQDIDLFLLRSSPVSLCSRGEETVWFFLLVGGSPPLV